MGFSNEVWQVCTTTTEDADCDKVVLNALRYFKQLMQWSEIRSNLEANISNLVSSLVVKNLGLTSNLLVFDF
jgi:exportin-2 (importin alpha re-exporter)